MAALVEVVPIPSKDNASVVSINPVLEDDNEKVPEARDNDTIIAALHKRLDELDQQVKDLSNKPQDSGSKPKDADEDAEKDADKSEDKNVDKDADEDAGKDADEDADADASKDGAAAFGSVAKVKLVPYDGSKRTYLVVTDKDKKLKSSAIVAFYDVPPSQAKDLEDDQELTLEAEDIPVRVVINSKHIISLLKSISDTSMGDEPCILLPPFKLFMHCWDDIQKKLPELEDSFKEAYGHGVDTASEPAEEDTPKKAGAPTKEEAKEKEQKDKKKSEIEHWRCLNYFIKTHLSSILELRETIRQRKIDSITFDNLWHLFNPGDIVLGREPFGQHKLQAYQVFSVTKGRSKMRESTGMDTDDNYNSGKQKFKFADRSSLQLQCFFLDYDGATVDTREERLAIKPYVGSKKITELDFYPKQFQLSADKPDSKSPSVLDGLMARALHFLERRYGHGACDCVTSRGTLEHVDSEVFVDFKSGYEHDPALNKAMGRFGVVSLPECSSEETFETACSVPECNSVTCKNAMYLDEQIDIKRADAIRAKLPKPIREGSIDALKERLKNAIDNKTKDLDGDLEHLLLLPRHLLVYALRGKQWHFIDVGEFAPFAMTEEDREKGFKNLVINEDYKHLLKAMVNDHASSMNNKSSISRSGTSIDIIRGKGRGRIIFLYGPPGVGKTSTAETIAAYTNPPRPLYPITCGDLGSKPEEIQVRLEGHFKLADRWNCVLLLDEADVYLAERTHADLDRNGIVSVFLRTLEYYSGILFLTSNREGSIDPAFKSRIHVALRYPRIDRKGTESIWANILDGIERENLDPNKKIKVKFDRAELLEWAGKHYDAMERPSGDGEEPLPTWNGRQIRNAFQSAIALASYDRIKVIQSHKLSEEMAMKKAVFRRIVLNRKHFQSISTVVREFENYLIQCGMSSDKTEKEGLRADSYGEAPRSAYDNFDIDAAAAAPFVSERRGNRRAPTPQQMQGVRKGQVQQVQRPMPRRRQSVLSGNSSRNGTVVPAEFREPVDEYEMYGGVDTNNRLSLVEDVQEDHYAVGDYDDLDASDDPYDVDASGDGDNYDGD